MTIHAAYSRWDRWTACGLPRRLADGRHNRCSSLIERVTCDGCRRIVGEPQVKSLGACAFEACWEPATGTLGGQIYYPMCPAHMLAVKPGRRTGQP